MTLLRRMYRCSLALVFSMMLASPALAMSEVENDTLQNGVKLSFVEDSTVPIVNLRFTFEGAGAASDTPGARGLSNFTAQMLLEGAGELSSEAFQNELAKHAIRMSTHVGIDHFTVAIETLSDKLPVALSLLGKVFSSPQFAEADIALMREQLIANLRRQQESPGYRASRLLYGHLFANHPYSNPVLGVEADIKTLDKMAMKRFMQTYLNRGNLLIAGAGDITLRSLRKLLKPVVKTLPRNDIGAINIARASMVSDGRILRESMNVPQTVIRFAMPWVARDDDAFYASYVLSSVLGGQGLSSLLMQDLRGGEDGLVYHVSTHLQLNQGANLLTGYAATRNDRVDEVIERITKRLQNIQAHGLTSEQCENGKTYLLGKLPLSLDSTSQLAETLRQMQLFDLPENYLKKRAGYFKSVTCEDIGKVAAKLFKLEEVTFAVIGGHSSPSQ